MLPDIFTSGDLLAFGDDTGSDLCVEFARSRASLCGSGLFTDTNGECDGGGEKDG